MINDELSGAADRLHDEAIRAIQTGSPSGYERVLEAYEGVLLAFPRAWARYGQRFDSEAAKGASLLGIGPTEELFGNLSKELVEAAASPSSEVALEAARVPARIARKAFELDAIALSERALRLGPRVYAAAERGAVGTDQKRAVKDRVWRGIFEFAEYVLAPIVQDWNADQPRRDRATEYLRQVFDDYSSLLKQILEARDTETLRKADEAWSRVLDPWEPEHEQPFESLVERMAVERGDEDPAVQDARRRLAIKQWMVSAKRNLDDLRSVHRFGLCMWALRRLRRSGSPAQFAPLFEHFASHFGDTDEIARVATLALAAEAEDSVPWSDWILFDLPEGKVHSVGADPEILNTFLTLMLRSDDLETRAPSLGPLEWLPHRLEQVENMLDETLRDETLRSSVLFGEDSLQIRAKLLKESLGRSARQQTGREEEQIRRSPLVPDKVEAFQEQVLDAWRQNRLAALLFRLAGSYEEAEEPLSDDDPRLSGVDEWLPKSLFVREPQVFGGDSIAHQMGFAIANGEVRELLRTLSDAPTERARASNTGEDVRGVIRSMSEEGYKPSAVFVPAARAYRMDTKLFDDAGPGGGTSDEGWNPETARRFRGYIEGVPTFDSIDVLEDRICVVDVASFAKWRQLTVDDSGGCLLVNIEDFSESQALDLANEHPNLLSGEGDDSAKVRAAKIRSNVYLKARERYEVRVRDPRACRWVTLQNEESVV